MVSPKIPSSIESFDSAFVVSLTMQKLCFKHLVSIFKHQANGQTPSEYQRREPLMKTGFIPQDESVFFQPGFLNGCRLLSIQEACPLSMFSPIKGLKVLIWYSVCVLAYKYFRENLKYRKFKKEMKNDALFLCLKITTIISLVHMSPVIIYNVDHAVYVGFQSLLFCLT